MDQDEQSVEELALEDKIAVLIDDLPAPLQDFLRSPQRDQISLRLANKYQLHADQAGIFDRAYLYMLLGVYTPDDFVQELKDTGIADEVVQGLTVDINELVFKRLQGVERMNPALAQPAPVPVPRPVPPPPALFQAPPAPPAPPAPAPFVPAAAPVPQSHPAIRTMAHDMQEMKHPTAPTPFQPATPARSFQTSSVPTTAVPPVSAPVPPVMPPIQPVAPRPMPPPPANLPGQPPIYVSPKPFAPPAASSAPIVKEYSVDPYREMPGE